MKPLLLAGLLVLVLGIASLFIAIPNRERNGVSLGGISVGIETRHDEKVSPLISGVLILAGGVMMIAGSRK